MLVLDLFAGVGGLGYGFRSAGFEVVGVEVNPCKAEAYALNVGRAISADVRSVDFSGFGAGILIAGPPCRPYSAATPKWRRGPLHPEYGLDAEVARAAKETKPAAVVVEEVPSWRPAPLARALRRLGYSVRAEVVAFSRFGAPTLRKRWVLVALRGGRPARVFRGLGEMAEAPPRPIDLISDLPKEPDGTNDHRACQIRSGIRGLIPLIPPGHSLASAYRAGLIPRSAAAKYVKDASKKHSYWLYRVPIEGLMKVVPHPRRSMALHPIYDRMLSVRELARLITYPDSFSFRPLGVDLAMRSIAESVPPKFSSKLALALARAIGSTCRNP